jgi:hypothetical protein
MPGLWELVDSLLFFGLRERTLAANWLKQRAPSACRVGAAPILGLSRIEPGMPLPARVAPWQCTPRAWPKAPKIGERGRSLEASAAGYSQRFAKLRQASLCTFTPAGGGLKKWPTGKSGATAKSTFPRYKQIPTG